MLGSLTVGFEIPSLNPKLCGISIGGYAIHCPSNLLFVARLVTRSNCISQYVLSYAGTLYRVDLPSPVIVVTSLTDFERICFTLANF